MPWSHAVLRALEIEGGPRSASSQIKLIARQLGIDVTKVQAALGVLRATGQVEKTRRGLRPRRVLVVDTGSDPARARELKLAWTKTALQRLEAHAPGNFGYSVFAIAKSDLLRLQTLHLEYVRAMQEVIASSSPNECVGLYCAQLLDLGATPSD
jgi:DNA-binding MarR family transcriptional regulator